MKTACNLKKMQENPFLYVVQKWLEGSQLSLLPFILLNFFKSGTELSHVNPWDVYVGGEISSLPNDLYEQSNNIFLWVWSLGSDHWFCQKVWDRFAFENDLST